MASLANFTGGWIYATQVARTENHTVPLIAPDFKLCVLRFVPEILPVFNMRSVSRHALVCNIQDRLGTFFVFANLIRAVLSPARNALYELTNR